MDNILKIESLLELKANISANKDRYFDKERSWISQYFKGKEYYIPNAVNLSRVELTISLESEKDNDIENIKTFYSANKHLSLEDAADARLWTYLTHQTYYAYTKQRWLKKDNSDILSRFFYSLKGMGKIRNSIARLWWYGKFTYDESYGDPFELLYDFIQDTDYIEQFYGRNFHKNHDLSRNILKALNNWKKKGNEYPKREKFRILISEINRKGAYSIIDNMSLQEIENIIEKVCG